MCLLSFTLQLFHPEEIEMLVCGCPEFNMHALESVTVYDEYDQADTTIRYNNKPQRLQGHYLQWTRGLGTRGSGTQGPKLACSMYGSLEPRWVIVWNGL